MRFCMVTTFYPPYHFGGDAVFVRALARALIRRGHEVEVVHCEDAYRLRGALPQGELRQNDDVVVHRLHSRFGLLSSLVTQQTGRPGLKAPYLEAVLCRKFDVVNFHNISLIGGPGVLMLSSAPVTLYTLHEHWLLCPTHVFWKDRSHACDKLECFRCCLRSGIPPQLWRYTTLIKRSLENVDGLLAPSRYTAKRHQETGLAVPVRVLPLFSDLESYIPIATTAIDRPYFLYVGRVTASKGIAALLKDFLSINSHDLVIAGDGDLRPALQKQYAQSTNIRFLGPVSHEHLIPLYQGATALILPSLAPESFGLSVIESFACGTPAIVHAAGGNREAVDITGAGYVYESRAELHQAMTALAGDARLRETLGKRARLGYEQHYTEERYMGAYLELIGVIQQRKHIN